MVITFTEYALRQEYSNLIEQWEQMRLHDGFVFSEVDNPMDRYGIRGAAQNLGQGMRNLGRDAMQAVSRGISSLSSRALNFAKQKADELMSMGMERLQGLLASKGYPNLLQKLNKYKNGLMILGVIAAGGLMALSGGQKPIDPAVMDQLLNQPRGTWEQMDAQEKEVIMNGIKLDGQMVSAQRSVDDLQKDTDSIFKSLSKPSTKSGATRVRETEDPLE